MNQENVYKELNNKFNKKRKRKRHRKRKENLTFSDIENLMKHDSYTRAPGGALKQRTWGK